MPTLTDLLSLTPAGDGEWTARITEDWGQGRAAFGGLLAGQALRAMGALVAPARTLRSLLVDFIGPAAPGTVRVEARVLRAGRALTQAEARIFQDDRPVAIFVAAFGAPRRTALHWPTPPRPALPAAEGLPALPHIPGITPAFTQHFDYRWTNTAFPFSGAAQPEIAGYLRPRSSTDGALADAALVVALIDAWPAPVLPLLDRPAHASTVTWMVDIVGDPAGAAPAGFWYFEGAATAADAGYADVHGRLFAPSGALVATSKQLVAEFSSPPAP